MSKKVGRNDPCHCGSGKKYKVCHGRSAASAGQKWMFIGGAVIVVGLGYFINKILTSDDLDNRRPGQVWSPEHGHWHDAPATSTPLSTPLDPQSPTVPTTEPPGPAPPGKVWSSEHGHWHDAPATSTPLSTPLSAPLNPQSPTVPTSEPPGPAPPGKVWSPEHGHWHDVPTESSTLTPASTELTPQPPGSAPPGKVWSPEHGHWHNAPATSIPIVPKAPSESIPE
jgi:hypothetical protein